MRLMKWMTGVVLLMLLGVSNLSAATCSTVSCVTMHDTIPNFAGVPTIQSVASGPWSDPQTWSAGRLPGAGDVVRIEGSTTVQITDQNAVAATVGVAAGGLLTVAPTAQTRLTVGTLQVLPGGVLEIGSAVAPVNGSAQIVFLDQPLDLVTDPRQFGTGLVVIDGTVTTFGLPKTTFERTRTEPLAGATALEFAQPVQGWMTGDRLVVPDSKQVANPTSTYVYEGEEVVIASVAPDGLSVTLTTPLRFNHPGARTVAGVIDRFPHIGNLTRTVQLVSANPLGVRGHVLTTERADVSMEFTAFGNLGRTTTAPLDNTIVSATGAVTHVGTNHVGRYPLHIHHVYGSASRGEQFRVAGNAIYNDEPTPTQKWGITVHGSHYGTIEQNVVYNAAGWGIGTEDGSESYNRFTRNFVVKVRGIGGVESAEAGNGFWMRGPNNYLLGNVVANAWGNSTHAFDLWFVYLGNICVPWFPGADMTQCQTVNGNTLPLRQFEDNEAYGPSEMGLAIWWVGTSGGYQDFPVSRSVVKNFSVWHFKNYGVFLYPVNNLHFDGLTVRYHKQTLANVNDFSKGVFFSDYSASNLRITNCDVQGARNGIVVPQWARGVTQIDHCYLRNASNIVVSTIGAPGAMPNGATLPPRTLLVQDVQFAAIDTSIGSGQLPLDIKMAYTLWNGTSNLTKSDRTFVTNYNQVAGDDFQVFFSEQADTFIVPQSSGQLIGAPVAGLTNAQTWATYGLAIGGEVATGAVPRTRIKGLVRPLSLPIPDVLPTLAAAPVITPVVLSVSGTMAFADGQPKPVTVTSTPTVTGIQVTYNGGTLAPSAPGTYTVVATLDAPGYTAQSVTTELFIAGLPVLGAWSLPLPSNTDIVLGDSLQPVHVGIGQSVILSVLPSVGVLTYQWQKNNRNITGAISSTYGVPAVGALDAGATFRCVMTSSAGTFASGEAQIVIP